MKPGGLNAEGRVILYSIDGAPQTPGALVVPRAPLTLNFWTTWVALSTVSFLQLCI